MDEKELKMIKEIKRVVNLERWEKTDGDNCLRALL